MASNSNINNKVTFWNNNSFTNNVTIINNIPTIKNQDESKIDNNGIYFNNDLNAPHIMYNGYVFTAGSYVSGTSINVTDNIYTIITSMSANTFSREISYNYTTIDLNNIYERLTYIETVLGRTTYIDELIITPNSYSINAGDTYNFKWETKSDKTPYFTGTDKKYSYTIDNFGKLTINSDNNISFIETGLSSDDDNPITKQISLTSYTGTLNNTSYIGESKTINITVSKQTQDPTIIGTIPNVIYVGNSPTTVTVDNIKDDATLEVKSSNPAVIEVSKTNYKVTLKALTAGSSDITIIIKSTGKYKKYEITKNISAEVKVTSVTVSPTSITLTEGETRQLTATINPDNASNKTVTWKSSNSTVAKVNSTGLVTAVSASSDPVTITVTTQDGNKTATCTVTVKAAQKYYWYVGQTMPDAVDESTWKSSTQDAGFTKNGITIYEGDNYLVIPESWNYTAIEPSTSMPFEWNSFVKAADKTKIPGYIIRKAANMPASTSVNVTFSK